MTASLKEIEQQAQAEWVREIENRVAAHDQDEVETYAAEDVFAEAKILAQNINPAI